MLILLLLATGFAIVQGLVQGLPDPSPATDAWGLSLESAMALDGVLWVDARPEAVYQEGHYPGAIHLSHDNLDSGLGQLLELWDPAMSILVYCDGEGCESSRSVAAELREILSEDRVYWLIGGWEELKEVPFQ